MVVMYQNNSACLPEKILISIETPLLALRLQSPATKIDTECGGAPIAQSWPIASLSTFVCLWIFERQAC